MVDTVGKCPLMTGSEAKVNLKLGTTFMARTSPLADSPRLVASLPCVLALVPLRRSRLKVKWTVERHLEWVVWEVGGKGLGQLDYQTSQ